MLRYNAATVLGGLQNPPGKDLATSSDIATLIGQLDKMPSNLNYSVVLENMCIS